MTLNVPSRPDSQGQCVKRSNPERLDAEGAAADKRTSGQESGEQRGMTSRRRFLVIGAVSLALLLLQAYVIGPKEGSDDAPSLIALGQETGGDVGWGLFEFRAPQKRDAFIFGAQILTTNESGVTERPVPTSFGVIPAGSSRWFKVEAPVDASTWRLSLNVHFFQQPLRLFATRLSLSWSQKSLEPWSRRYFESGSEPFRAAFTCQSAPLTNSIPERTHPHGAIDDLAWWATADSVAEGNNGDHPRVNSPPRVVPLAPR